MSRSKTVYDKMCGVMQLVIELFDRNQKLEAVSPEFWIETDIGHAFMERVVLSRNLRGDGWHVWRWNPGRSILYDEFRTKSARLALTEWMKKIDRLMQKSQPFSSKSPVA